MNFKAMERAAGPATEILAVVKANAYGHGAVTCAPILVRAGARWLGVTNAAEGAQVRQALSWQGLKAGILVMSGFLPEDVPALLEYELVPVVWTPEQVACLAGTSTRIHVEVDTGMGRQGVAPGQPLDALLAEIVRCKVSLDGLFTHFCSSEVAASALTEKQQRRFAGAVAQARALGTVPVWVHAGNSSTIDNPAEPDRWLGELAATVKGRAMVRSGLALYGYALPIEGDVPAQVRSALKPVMHWQAAVLATRELAVGDTVGYNATFTATQPMRAAVLGVGYADGLRRELSGGAGWVMIAGERCPIVGRVSMNLTVVDISHLGEVATGDVATILGEGITADDHARLAGTIAYEILCGVHPCG